MQERLLDSIGVVVIAAALILGLVLFNRHQRRRHDAMNNKALRAEALSETGRNSELARALKPNPAAGTGTGDSDSI